MRLADKVNGVEPGVRTSPWPGTELLRGYAVMALPFSSGYLLALRVWKQNDFAPYRSVWIRRPAGEWRMVNDGPLLETTCPRYWGPVVSRAELGKIDLTWKSQDELAVEMDQPRLTWKMRMACPLPLRIMNVFHAALPLWTWQVDSLVRIREWMAAEMLKMGEVQFSFRTPRGQRSLILPREIFLIRESQASLEGESLGCPVHLPHNPTIGDVRLPARPAFATGQSFVHIDDQGSYRQLRQRVQNIKIRQEAGG